jgi:hypothetical protein
VSQTLADNDAFVVVVTVSIVEGTDDGIDTSAIDLFERTGHVIM